VTGDNARQTMQPQPQIIQSPFQIVDICLFRKKKSKSVRSFRRRLSGLVERHDGEIPGTAFFKDPRAVIQTLAPDCSADEEAIVDSEECLLDNVFDLWICWPEKIEDVRLKRCDKRRNHQRFRVGQSSGQCCGLNNARRKTTLEVCG